MSKYLLLLTLTLTIAFTYSAKDETQTSMPTTMDQTSGQRNQANETFLPNDPAIIEYCNSTFMIGSDYIEALQMSGSFPDETDRTPKCYVKCLLETIGVADLDEETFDAEKTAMVFAGHRSEEDMDYTQQLAVNCSQNRKESCKCDRAYQFFKCFLEKEIEKYGST